MFSTIKDEKNVKWMFRKKVAEDAVAKQQSMDFRYDFENFGGIAKISQS